MEESITRGGYNFWDRLIALPLGNDQATVQGETRQGTAALGARTGKDATSKT